MAKLIPLSDIPTRAARDAERAARASYPNRSAALQAARYEIVDAPGTYSGAFPRSRGWCCSRSAATAVASQIVRMPGNTNHALFAVRSDQ